MRPCCYENDPRRPRSPRGRARQNRSHRERRSPTSPGRRSSCGRTRRDRPTPWPTDRRGRIQTRRSGSNSSSASTAREPLGPRFPFAPGTSSIVEGPARFVLPSPRASGATFPIHCRRDRHRTAPRDAASRAGSLTSRSDSLQREHAGRFAYETSFERWPTRDRLSSARRHAIGGRRRGQARAGRLGRAELQSLVHDPATLCFVCGPPALVVADSSLLANWALPRERIKTGTSRQFLRA